MNTYKKPISILKDKINVRKEQVKIQYLDLTADKAKCPYCGKLNKRHQNVIRWVQGIDTDINFWF